MYGSGLFAFFYLDYTTARAMPTIPNVSISETHIQNPVTADHSVVVFGQANDQMGSLRLNSGSTVRWLPRRRILIQDPVNPLM